MISLKEFQKLELRIAEIKEVEDITGKDKLFKIKIDLGDEERTIVAGIKKSYEKEELIGKQIVVITNLEPAMICGIKSEAMLLAAGDDAVLLTTDRKVKNGAKVK